MPRLLATVTIDPSADVIRLPPLTSAAVAQLVESRLGGAPDPGLHRRLPARNPRRAVPAARGSWRRSAKAGSLRPRRPRLRREHRGADGRPLDSPPASSAAGACGAAGSAVAVSSRATRRRDWRASKGPAAEAAELLRPQGSSRPDGRSHSSTRSSAAVSTRTSPAQNAQKAAVLRDCSPNSRARTSGSPSTC